MSDLSSRARMVYSAGQERLWIWNSAESKWFKPATWAVSGGGRGQGFKVGGKWTSFPYGINGQRRNTARFSNMTGVKGASATAFGPIPNGLYKVGHPFHDHALGNCAKLTPVQGLMMGRHGFYIHGQGRIGSEGCIVPVHGQLWHVLHLIRLLQKGGPLYLRVEGSSTYDFPDKPDQIYA